nr:DUF4265 domain-containing protein [uncultured Flavobacterium sp.]
MEQENFREILFQYESNITNEEITEALWAEIVNAEENQYMLYSIPLHGFMIAPGDIFVAVEEEVEGETFLVFDHVTNYSGNSVIQVIIPEEEHTAEVEEKLNDLASEGCHLDKINENIILMAVPFEVDFNAVKSLLDGLAATEVLDYAEPIISDKHQEDIADAEMKN